MSRQFKVPHYLRQEYADFVGNNPWFAENHPGKTYLEVFLRKAREEGKLTPHDNNKLKGFLDSNKQTTLELMTND